MKLLSYLILLILSAQLASAYSRYYQRRGQNRRTYLGRVKKTPILPPPEVDSEEETDEARGLRGQANVLASIQKSKAKCSISGSYGIRGECRKFMDCQRAGLIPTSRYCPTGKFFDHLERTCLSSSSAKCKDVCHEDGEVFIDPGNQNGYLKCVHMVPMPYNCKEQGEVFSPDEQECVEGSDVLTTSGSEEEGLTSNSMEDVVSSYSEEEVLTSHEESGVGNELYSSE